MAPRLTRRTALLSLILAAGLIWPAPTAALMILTSVEYQDDIIQAWYQHYLGRAATDAEAINARNTINMSGGTDEQAIAIILGSVEYFNRAGLCNLYLPLIMS
jgi:hypothetical protein